MKTYIRYVDDKGKIKFRQPTEKEVEHYMSVDKSQCTHELVRWEQGFLTDEIICVVCGKLVDMNGSFGR